MVSTIPRLMACLFSVYVASASDWPQWRGPDRSGHIRKGETPVDKLPSELSIPWRLKVGDGLASPIVAKGKVFYLDNQVGKETVHAVEASSGKLIWSTPLDDAFKDTQSASGPRCTPLFDSGRIYAQSCRGELQCLDAGTGKLLWRISYVTNLGSVFTGEKGQAAGAARHGYNGSPLIDGEHLITLAGGTNGAAVACLDKVTGEVVWKSQDDGAAYAPPILATVAGRRQIIAFTVDGLIGIEPTDGHLLWRVPLKTTFGRHVTTPVVSGEVVMVSSHEIGLIGVRIGTMGSGLTATVTWTNKQAAINFASPVVVGGYLYCVGPAKNLICVDAATGEMAWSKDGVFTSAAGKAHAGFVVAGRNLLVLTDGGELLLVACDPSHYDEIGRTQICGANWCNPAYSEGRIYVRDGRELLCAILPR